MIARYIQPKTPEGSVELLMTEGDAVKLRGILLALTVPEISDHFCEGDREFMNEVATAIHRALP